MALPLPSQALCLFCNKACGRFCFVKYLFHVDGVVNAMTAVLADEVALDLSTMPGTDCGVEWTEGPCVLWFEAITAEDYQPVQPPQLICFPFRRSDFNSSGQACSSFLPD